MTELDVQPPSSPSPRGDSAVLRLARSGLSLESDCLVRRKDTDVVARHPIESVSRVRLTSAFDPMNALVALVLGALAWVAWSFIEIALLSWSLAVVLGGVALLGFASARSRRLVIETEDGSVAYPLQEELDEIEGFTLSLRRILRERATRSRPSPFGSG